MIQSWRSLVVANLAALAERASEESLGAFTLTVDLSRLRFGDGGRGPVNSPHLGSPDGNMDNNCCTVLRVTLSQTVEYPQKS
jgi:hypothetical protein